MEAIISIPKRTNFKNWSKLELAAHKEFNLNPEMLVKRGYEADRVGQWKVSHSPDQDGCHEVLQVLAVHIPHGITEARIGILYKDG